MKNSKLFKNKVLMITGGTGSFGNAVTRRFIDSDLKEIRIFSRDEKKQDDMRKKLKNPKKGNQQRGRSREKSDARATKYHEDLCRQRFFQMSNVQFERVP